MTEAALHLFPIPGETRGEAVLSDDGLYRYVLRRAWEPGHDVTWIMLNPSTADAHVNDPTVRAILAFSRSWGMGSLTVVNLYAWRSPFPKALNDAPDPVGPGNAGAIIYWIRRAHLVVAAWGANRPPGIEDRIAFVQATAAAGGKQLHSLGRTADGSPRHPGRLARATQLEPWPPS